MYDSRYTQGHPDTSSGLRNQCNTGQDHTTSPQGPVQYGTRSHYIPLKDQCNTGQDHTTSHTTSPQEPVQYGTRSHYITHYITSRTSAIRDKITLHHPQGHTVTHWHELGPGPGIWSLLWRTTEPKGRTENRAGQRSKEQVR